jgi:membrane protease YdiL (CAAX protease family)
MSVWLIDIALHAVWGLHVPAPLTLLPIGHFAVVVVVMAAMWSCGRSFRDYLALSPLRWSDVGRGIGYGALGFVGMMMVFIAIGLLQKLFGAGPSTAPTIAKLPFNMQSMLLLASIWFMMVVAAPIAEELLFRGLLYRGLAESRVGIVATMVLTSMVFGLMHYPGFGWSRVIATGCMGLLLAWLRWHNGNTSIGIVAHAATNTIAAAILTTVALLS